MTNYLKLTKEEYTKAEKILREAGITFQADIDLSSEMAIREVDYFFEEFPADIEAYHEEKFSDMDFDKFKEFLREEVLHNIVNNDTGFFPGPEAVESELEDLVSDEVFISDCREMTEDSII